METSGELLELRALKEAQAAILKTGLRSCSDAEFLVAASDVAEMSRDVDRFITEESKRRGLSASLVDTAAIGKGTLCNDKDCMAQAAKISGVIYCVTLRDVRNYKPAKFLIERATEQVITLFGRDQIRAIGLMFSAKTGRFMIEGATSAGEYMARFFVESLEKTLGADTFKVETLRVGFGG